MRQKIKICIEIGLYFVFIYFFVIIPYFDKVNIDVISAVMFLNFSTLEILNINKFNLQYLIMFILFYQIIIYPKILEVSNNLSFFSLSLHKLGKKKQLKHILSDNFKYVVMIYFYILLYAIIFEITVSILNNSIFEYEILFQISIYLIKYLSFIFTIMSINQIICIIKEYLYFVLQSYFILIILVVNDIFFSLSIITLSSSIINEFLGLIIIIIIESIGMIITIYKFLKVKEIYND